MGTSPMYQEILLEGEGISEKGRGKETRGDVADGGGDSSFDSWNEANEDRTRCVLVCVVLDP